jgi:hypothetical protein
MGFGIKNPLVFIQDEINKLLSLFEGPNVAIGYLAGNTDQGINSIAIGENAGTTSQDDNSIVINSTGLVQETTNANQIVLNSSTTAITTNSFPGLYVSPLRQLASTPSDFPIYYDVTANELRYHTVSGPSSNIISSNLGETTLTAESQIKSMVDPNGVKNPISPQQLTAGDTIVYTFAGQFSSNYGMTIKISPSLQTGTQLFTSSILTDTTSNILVPFKLELWVTLTADPQSTTPSICSGRLTTFETSIVQTFNPLSPAYSDLRTAQQPDLQLELDFTGAAVDADGSVIISYGSIYKL